MRTSIDLENLMLTLKHDFDRNVTRNPSVSQQTKAALWVNLIARLAPVSSELDTVRVEEERLAILAYKAHERELVNEARRNRKKSRAA